MKVPDILNAPEEAKKKQAKVDLKFERIIIQCAIGCLVNDLPMSDEDYVRMYLAFSRVLGST